MKGRSIIGLLENLPAGFGETLLIFGFVLCVAPYLAGADFGIFRIPDFSENKKRKLRIWGPVFLGFVILLYVPILSLFSKNDVVLSNPFGDREILLNGEKILVPDEAINKKKTEADFVSQKLLFKITLPPPKAGMEHELVDVGEYEKALSKGDVGFMGVKFSGSLAKQPVFRNAKIFRIYRSQPFLIETTPETYIGPKGTESEYNNAMKIVGYSIPDLLNSIEINNNTNENDEGENLSDDVKINDEKMTMEYISDLTEETQSEEFTELLKNLQSMLANFTEKANIFNELVIMIVDRHQFEQVLMAFNRGRKIKASPLIFLLEAGGALPKFDILSVEQAAVSGNNRVWGFYGHRQICNVKVDGVLQDTVYNDFYRLYAMNSAYIYQITLSYIPGLGHPRTTWDYLVKALSSFRIAASPTD